MGAIVVLLLLLWAVPASATTFYVSATANTPAGSDARSCGTAQSISTPKATIASGITCLSAGDTLFVRGGTYQENALLDNFVGHSGTSWANKVRVAAYQTETVWFDPQNFAAYWAMLFTQDQQYVEFDGININSSHVQGAVRLDSDSGNPHHFRFQNAEVIGGSNGISDPPLAEPQAITVSQKQLNQQGGNEFLHLTVHGGGDSNEHYYAFYISTDNTLISDCIIYNMRAYAIQVYSAWANHPTVLNVTIRNNIIHDIIPSQPADRSGGIIVDSGSGHAIYNNVVYDLPAVSNGAGIRVYGDDDLVYNNTIYNVGSIGIQTINSATRTIIRNNIAFGNGTDCVNAGVQTTHTNNLYGAVCSNSGTYTSNVNNLTTADPGFTSIAADDYSIITTSPAKDVGITIALVTTDQRGLLRPYNTTYDIGAYEFNGVVPDPDVDTPAAGTIFVSDAFTGSSGANLVTSMHVAEVGGLWAYQSGISNSPVISDANRLRGGAADVDTFVYNAGTPVSAEYDVNVPVHTFTTVVGHTFLIWARMLSVARTGYFAIYNLDPGTLQLWVVVASNYTFLGSCDVTFADASDHTVRLEVRDIKKKLYYDSTLCTSSSDNSVSAAGLAGVGIYTPTTAATNSTSFHLSSLEGRDVQTSMVQPPQVTSYRLRFTR